MGTSSDDVPMSLEHWAQEFVIDQARGKATIRIPLAWLPYFLGEDVAADVRAMRGQHLALCLVALLAVAAASLGLARLASRRRRSAPPILLV